MNKKLISLLGGVILGASLCGCVDKPKPNRIKMDVTGYVVEDHYRTVGYTFEKQWNEVIVRDGKLVLYDGGLCKLDGKVDSVLSKVTYSKIERHNLSKEQAKEFDELLAQYQKSLNIDKVHKEWEERYKK